MSTTPWMVVGEQMGDPVEEYDSTEMSMQEAAEKYIMAGEWGQHDGQSSRQTAYVLDPDDVPDGLDSSDESTIRRHGVAIDVDVPADEPPCRTGEGEDEETHPEHAWEREQTGCAENPGVHGHGGGVIILEVCSRCGVTRETDTWADDGHGEHYTAVTYTR